MEQSRRALRLSAEVAGMRRQAAAGIDVEVVTATRVTVATGIDGRASDSRRDLESIVAKSHPSAQRK
jgi:hypothetical protein